MDDFIKKYGTHSVELVVGTMLESIRQREPIRDDTINYVEKVMQELSAALTDYVKGK